MKKLQMFFAFVFVMLIFVSQVCSAKTVKLEYNEDGAYRIKSQEWVNAKITAEPAAVEYVNRFSEAISKPGVPILVKKSEEFSKLKLDFKKIIEVDEAFIVYDKYLKKISYLELEKQKEEPSYLVLYSIASIILMIISSILLKTEKEFFRFQFAAKFLLPVFAAISLFFVAQTTVGLTSFAAALAVFAAILADFSVFCTLGEFTKTYKTISAIFYCLVIINIILLF